VRQINIYIFYLLLLLLANASFAQVYIPADPQDLLFTEQKIMVGGEDPGSLMIRPLALPQSNANVWSLKVRSELFYNEGAPNLENTSNKWVSKGISFFTSANMAFNSKYLFVSTEPFIFTSQNKNYNEPVRLSKFMHLNDNLAHSESPYNRLGLRETQIYLKYQDYGIGWSNANMWWGPGIHSSLMMSNNTTGFGHLMLGTVSEKRYKNWGFNGRYVFSKFGKRSISKPYYSGIVFNSTYYSNPIVTLGISRSFLSGGQLSPYKIGAVEAALLPFQFVEIKTSSDIYGHMHPIDYTFALHSMLKFPESNTVLYFEWGRNEAFSNIVLTPDHSDGYTLGFRRYGIFNNLNMFISLEYTNIALSAFWDQKESFDWFSNYLFDYNTFDGRYFTAHSGPDSDDFSIIIGYTKKGFSVIIPINYERHSLTHTYIKETQLANTLAYDKYLYGEHFIVDDKEIYTRIVEYPETKLEIGLDFRLLIKKYKIFVKYEFEHIFNYEFLGTHGSEGNKSSNVFKLGIERTFDFNEGLFK